jgi:hypothetical protein
MPAPSYGSSSRLNMGHSLPNTFGQVFGRYLLFLFNNLTKALPPSRHHQIRTHNRVGCSTDSPKPSLPILWRTDSQYSIQLLSHASHHVTSEHYGNVVSGFNTGLCSRDPFTNSAALREITSPPLSSRAQGKLRLAGDGGVCIECRPPPPPPTHTPTPHPGNPAISALRCVTYCIPPPLHPLPTHNR